MWKHYISLTALNVILYQCVWDKKLKALTDSIACVILYISMLILFLLYFLALNPKLVFTECRF